jgi:predicted dehydrogenase
MVPTDKDSGLSRREFLRQGSSIVAGAAGLAALGAPAILSAQNVNSRINIGFIGTGSRAGEILRSIAGHPEKLVTDLCDIYPPHIELAKKDCGNDKARTCSDWRKVLEQKDVDAIAIAAPLYIHVPVSVAGLDAGKHVFSEKSMGMNMKELNDMLGATRRHPDKVYMVGYQSRLNESLAMV